MTMLGAENPILGNSAPIHRHAHHMVYTTDASGKSCLEYLKIKIIERG